MTSENLGSSDFAEEYLEFRKVLFSRDDPTRLLLCGSFFELPTLYILSNPTDVDIMECDITFCAIYTSNPVNLSAGRKTNNVLTIDATDCQPGYVRLRHGAKYFTKPCDFISGPAYTNQVSFHDACLSYLMEKINTRWRDICMFSRDYVYAISCPQWPPEAHEWITRERLNGWPPKDAINVIVEIGCHLVSKPHAKNLNDGTQWRYSFSQAETILIHNTWTDVQKYIYHLLRIIKADVVSRCGGENETFISTYYFKTLMLWACEEKSSDFWEERNIATSVKELLLDLIEKLIERNVPHYFMPANNIMDDFPCSPNVDNVALLLLCYREEEILEIIRIEPKAYKMTSFFLTTSNEIIYPLATAILTNTYKSLIIDRFSQKYCTPCSFGKFNNDFYPELEYLHRGIVLHLQLSKLNNYENGECRQKLIALAKEFFDLSINKLDYGVTRIRLNLGWSVFQHSQQVLLLCKDYKHFQDQNPMLYSASRAPRTVSTSCYVRDRGYFIRNIFSFSENRAEIGVYPILQEIGLMLSELTIGLPVNPTHLICSAYKANFFYNALCDYRKAIELCKEVDLILTHSSASIGNNLLGGCDRFPLRNEWSELYDKYIQIVFGFLTLHRTLTASSTSRKRMIPIYICSDLYLRYIYTRCCKMLNEPVVDFGFNSHRFRGYKIDIMWYTVSLSKTILQTALRIS